MRCCSPRGLAIVMALAAPACVYAGLPLPGEDAADAGPDATTGGPVSQDAARPPDAGRAVPTGTWQSAVANIADIGEGCRLHAIAVRPDRDRMIVGVEGHGLWASDDGAMSWNPLGQGAGSATIKHGLTSVVFDPLDPQRFWETGIHGGVGLYATGDDGATFQELGPVQSIDLVSVDFSDPERNVIVAGGHEQARSAFRSRDAGKTWEEIGANLPGDASCTYPLVIDAETYLMGCSYTSTGIYRTTDGGSSWTQVSAKGGVGSPLRASDGSIYWTADFGEGMFRSTDDGETWEQVAPAGLLKAFPPQELEDGRIAALGSEYVVVSDDQGSTWAPASAPYPHSNISGWLYSPHQRAFFIKQFSCDSDALLRYDLD